MIGLPLMLMDMVSINGEDESAAARAQELMSCFTRERLLEIYVKYMNHPDIKWNSFIIKVIGLDIPLS